MAIASGKHNYLKKKILRNIVLSKLIPATMYTHLIKIEKTIKGTAQLFTAMDKGFAKVESDMTLLKNFRLICFEANQKIESALPSLQSQIGLLNPAEHTELSGEVFRAIMIDILCLRQVISDNIVAISEYINGFEELWKTSFSLNALLKFKLLLIEEFTNLENHIRDMEMEQRGKERLKNINLHPSSRTQVYRESI
jgi:hypothetical protein